MNYKYLTVLIITFLILNLNNAYAQKNKILFKINNQIVTSYDLLEETKYLKALNIELENTKKEVIYEIAKKSLVRHKVKEIELLNKLEDYKIDEKVLADLLLNQFSRLNINSNNDLNIFFKEKNIDREYVTNRVKIDVLWNEFIFAKYSKKVKVDVNKIKKELKNKTKEKEFLLSEILFNLDSNESLEQKFKLIAKTIKEKGFSEAALSYSISSSSDSGGRIGWIRETTLNNKINDKLNNIEIGDHTKPLVIPGGFLILKIDNKRNTEIELDLDQVVKEISQKKINEQLNQYSSIYYNKIKKNITINEF